MLGRDKHFSLLAFIISKREKSLITMTPCYKTFFFITVTGCALACQGDQSDQKIEQKFAQHMEM